MEIGDVIRKYRKNKKLTQEEMAKRLGVTAPAVNKWENGNSLPDITLLSPIARLLDVSVDTLLSHEKALSDQEAAKLVEEALEKLKAESFEYAFKWIKQCLLKYPNCTYLILWMARIMESQKQMTNPPDSEKYDSFILDCYKRVLESDDEKLRTSAAESLYSFYLNKEDYSHAEECLSCLPQESSERKQKQATIFSKTGRRLDAYKSYEELLYSGYQNLSGIFNDIYILAIEENDLERAHMLVKKRQALASLFEFGEYHEISPGLELSILEKDEEETLNIVERMLENTASISAFTKSPLFSHMGFREIDSSFVSQMREDLLKGFRDEETYAFLKENQRWHDLISSKRSPL